MAEYNLYSESEAKHTFSPSEPQTNADRIRAMSDEELAVWLAGATDCGVCPEGGTDCSAWTCDEAWLKWLKEEAE